MFNTKKKRLSPEEQRQKSSLEKGYGRVYDGPAPREKKKEVFRSKEEILNTPIGIRNRKIPSDYFDVIPDDYYPTDDYNL